MNGFDWFIRNLPRSFEASKYGQTGNTFVRFDLDGDPITYVRSAILKGRIIFKNPSDEIQQTPMLLIKVMPSGSQRLPTIDLTFAKEMYAYNKILPFFASFDDTIWNILPRFYFGNLTFGEAEEGFVALENLQESDYRAPESKLFLDVEHLSLMMKKLGQFHAYSYFAKNTQPEKFHSLAINFTETHYTVWRLQSKLLPGILQIYLDRISADQRYADKVAKLRELVKDPNEFSERVLTKRNGLSVICHGDYLRNNALFKYHHMKPVDMKIIDVADMRYCSPVVDIALVLYMNADQKTRDRYWDQLLDIYYNSLKNTFPNANIPTKDEILYEFKINILHAFFCAMSFIPAFLECERINSDNIYDFIYPNIKEEYRNLPPSLIPEDVFLEAWKKILTDRNCKFVLDMLIDIFNKKFV